MGNQPRKMMNHADLSIDYDWARGFDHEKFGINNKRCWSKHQEWVCLSSEMGYNGQTTYVIMCIYIIMYIYIHIYWLDCSMPAPRDYYSDGGIATTVFTNQHDPGPPGPSSQQVPSWWLRCCNTASPFGYTGQLGGSLWERRVCRSHVVWHFHDWYGYGSKCECCYFLASV